MPKLIQHGLSEKEFHEKRKEGKSVDEEDKSPFNHLARTIYRYPIPFLLFMPILCIIFIGSGFSNAQIEDSVDELWARKDSDYFHNLEYKARVKKDAGDGGGDGGNSGALCISKPRKGNNIISTDYLNEIKDRMNATENVVITHKGETYTFDDVCYNPAGPYEFPCFRMTTMDCFEQGGYSFDSTAAEAWRDLVISSALDTAIATVMASTVNQATATTFCSAECNTTSADWADDDTCEPCYTGFLNANHSTQFNTIYYMAVNAAWSTSYTDAQVDALMAIALNSTVRAGIRSNKVSVINDYITYCIAVSACPADTTYANSTQTELDTYYYTAMFGQLSTTSQAYVDAYVQAAVETTVYAAASDSTVNQAIATSFCASDSGDRGYCNVSSSTWSTNSDCVSCYQGFLNGSMSVQSDYIYYTALRSSLATGVTGGVTDFELYVTYKYYATVCGCNISTDAFLTDTTCYSCYYPAYSGATTAARSAAYYTAMVSTVGSTDTDVIDAWALAYVRTEAYGSSTAAYSLTDDFLDAYVEAGATATLEALVAGQTPYTFQVYSDPMGQPRTSTSNDDSTLLSTVSGTCYNWDEGLLLPKTFHVMTLGGTSPNSPDGINSTEPYSKVKATQSIYYFLTPQKIQKRVALSARPAGAITLSKSDAEEVMYKFKKEFEETFSKGWDDDKAGDVEFVGFTDDTGVVGSFGRTLLTFTLQSVPLSLACYAITAVVCSLLLANFRDYVRSRMALGMFGALVAVIAFSAAIGLTALFNIKLNIVQMWTLPFLMVGLGMDDMFILALAADVFFSKEENKRNGRHNMETAEHIFIEAYENVGIPVSLTSVVNAAMFSIMTISDIAAVKLTAITAVISVILLYLTMMTSFAAAIALDFKRQIENRNDVFCCFDNYAIAVSKVDPKLKAKKMEEEEKDGQTLPQLKHFFWDRGYAPMMKSIVGRVLILVIALVLFILACVGLSQMQIGLGLEEFFPEGSLGNRFASLQSEFFPTWPAQMNWGKVKYYDKDTQLDMMEQFEDVVLGKRVTTIDTDYLWTASVAEWSMIADYDLGYCDSSSVLTSGNCGPVLSTTCTGTWVENTPELRLAREGGVCRSGSELAAVNSSYDTTKEYCPVLHLSEADYAMCVGLYVNYTLLYSTLAPGFALEDDKMTPQVPIKFSKASGSTMFTYDLDSTEAYVSMISDARDACDDSSGPHCWVSGIAFEYWEQYITIETWLLEISGFGLLIAFAVSSIFFYIGFNTHGQKESGAPPPSLICGVVDQQDAFLSLICGLIVALNSALSLFVVVGMSALSGVNMCGLSAMACLMSAGFSVEFSVHVVHRFVEADPSLSPVDRVIEGVESLFMPTALGFISSAVGIMTLLFSRFSFVLIYFFVPLFIMLVVTFFFGIFMLPAILSVVDVDIFKLHGKVDEANAKPKEVEVELVNMEPTFNALNQTKTPDAPINNANEGPIFSAVNDGRAEQL